MLKDGDRVTLTKPCKVDRYWFDPEFMSRGSYDFAHMLPGAEGVVVRAKTPCVTYAPGREPAFFANVDVACMGHTFRVREFHNHFKKVRT